MDNRICFISEANPDILSYDDISPDYKVIILNEENSYLVGDQPNTTKKLAFLGITWDIDLDLSRYPLLKKLRVEKSKLPTLHGNRGCNVFERLTVITDDGKEIPESWTDKLGQIKRVKVDSIVNLNKSMIHFKSLELRAFAGLPEEYAVQLDLPSMKKLKLYLVHVKDLKYFTKFTNLEELYLVMEDPGTCDFTGFPNLKYLYIWNYQMMDDIDDDNFKFPASLRGLFLPSPNDLEFESISALSKQLCELMLGSYDQSYDKLIRRFTNLKRLTICNGAGRMPLKFAYPIDCDNMHPVTIINEPHKARFSKD